jgi:V/A-type H+-transporting ATPase subunit C
MASNGISGYAAVNARVRVMYSTLLTPQEMNRLFEAPDFNNLIEQLKHTAYGPYLEQVRDRDLTPRRAAFQLRERLANAYSSIIGIVPEQTRPLLIQLYRFFEVSNLKAVLRGIVKGESWNVVKYLLFPFGPRTVIPAEEMMATGNIAPAVELLRGTPYYETLSYAMKRYNAEQSLFPLEVTLDLNYWRDLWKNVKQLSSLDKTQASRIIGTMLDITNLMWAIRYRTYYRLSEEEVINYTLPFGYHVHDEDIRGIAAGADIAQIVQRVYPNLTQIESLIAQSGEGLSQLELQLQRRVYDQCQAAFVGDPFHIGIPLAYLLLSDLEIQDLVVLIEAKSSNIPAEKFKQYMVMRN